MARVFNTPEDLTENERRVLRHMTTKPGNELTAASFSNVATSKSDKSQWAGPILKRLVEFGLVTKSEKKLGTSSAFKQTPAGFEASRQAPPALPEMTIFEMKAVLEMHEAGRIRVDAECDPDIMLGAQEAYYNDLCTFEPASNGAGANLYWLNENGRFIDPASLRDAIEEYEATREAPCP